MGTAPNTMTQSESETPTTADSDADADAESDSSSALREVLSSGTFTLDDVSFEQITYDQVGVDVGVHASKDQLESEWGHRFVHPDGQPDFRAPDKLKAKLKSQLDPYRNAESDRDPRKRLVGPTGSAKSLSARHFACQLADEDDEWPFDMGYPMFEITLSHVTSQAQLVGRPAMSQDGSNTEYILGPIPKALLASQVCPVVLFLDEVNRSPLKDALFEAIDGRRQIRIDGFGGGMTIRGNPHNLIVISAMNAGPGYKTEPLDFAGQRRLGPVSFITYLADYDKTPIENYPNWNGEDEEISLVADLSPASEETAAHIVRAGQNIRAMAHQGDERIKPIPTDSLVEWAKLAHNFHTDGISDPVYEAGKEVVKGMYDQTRTFTQKQTSPLEKVITSEITDVKAVDYVPKPDDEDDEASADDVTELTDLPNVGEKTANRFEDAGYDTPDDIRDAIQNGTDISDVYGVGRHTADSVEEWATDDADDGAGGEQSHSVTGKKRCKAGCGFEISAETAQAYLDDKSARPDDDNDYSVLKFGRCPGCGQPVETVEV